MEGEAILTKLLVFQNTTLAMHSYSFFLNVLVQESVNSKQRKCY